MLRPIVSIALLVLFSHTALCVSSQKADAAAREDRGLELAHAGDLVGAEAELRSAVRLAPDNPELLANLATVLALEKKLEDSTKFFQRALRLDPNNLTARRYLAANLWQLHRYPEARENLELILKRQERDGPSRLLLGMVAENMKDYGTAVRMLSSVPAEVQKQPESIAALAVSYYHLEKKEKARRTLEDLKNHPAGARAVLLGAQIADEARDYDTAEQLLNSLKSTYSDEEDLGYRLATVQYHAGRFDQCEQTLLRSVGSRDGNGQALNLLGWCYQKQHRVDDAKRTFEDGISVQPEDESNYLDLQNLLLASHRIPAALELAKRSTAALPNSARAFTMRGSIEMRANQFSNAVESYRRAQELDPASAAAVLGLADAEFAAGMKKNALGAFAAGIQKFPKDARFPLHYALALMKEAESSEPLATKHPEELLKRALKLDPTLAEAHYQLAELALADGDTSEAVRHYQTAAKIEPQDAKVHFGLAKAYRRLGKTALASRETELFQRLQEVDSRSAAMPQSGESPEK